VALASAGPQQIICTSFQTDNNTSTSSLNFIQARCCSWWPTNSVRKWNWNLNRHLERTGIKTKMKSFQQNRNKNTTSDNCYLDTMSNAIKHRVVDWLTNVLHLCLGLLRENNSRMFHARQPRCRLVRCQLADFTSRNFFFVYHHNLHHENDRRWKLAKQFKILNTMYRNKWSKKFKVISLLSEFVNKLEFVEKFTFHCASYFKATPGVVNISSTGVF